VIEKRLQYYLFLCCSQVPSTSYFPGERLQYVKARDAHRKVELNPCKNDLGVARALLDEIGLITSRWSEKEPVLVDRTQEIGRTGIVS